MTVYTIRLSTSFERGASQTEPLAGVNVCLINKSGAGLLHRISPISDPEQNQAAVQHICSFADAGLGANCSLPPAPASPYAVRPAIKPRFQQGSIDEVCFLSPEMGPLAAVMVAPEGASWLLDELDVCSSRTNHMDRFVCRKRLGGRRGEAAAYMTPVPPGAVVYGSGDAAVVLTKEQAAVLHAMGMSEYDELKQRLLMTTAMLSVAGSGVAAVLGGVDAAAPFAVGGMAGLLYQYLLQRGVDSLPATGAKPFNALSSGSAEPQRPAAAATATAPAALDPLLSSGAFRLAFVTTAALLAVWCVQQQAGVTTGSSDSADSLGAWHMHSLAGWQLLVGGAGFLMFKVAVLGVTLAAPIQVDEPAKQYEKESS